MTDDGGVLENLPHSRPGRRSEKRPAKSSAKAADRAERTGSKAARPAAGAARPGARRPRPAPGAVPRGEAPGTTASSGEHSSSSDPVGDVIRTAAGVATLGARIANGVAREVLRRVPRP
jgi:hypothetical protein